MRSLQDHIFDLVGLSYWDGPLVSLDVRRPKCQLIPMHMYMMIFLQ